MPETITIGGKSLTYELIRKKVKNINMRIKPDGRIIISASNRVSKKHIEDFMKRKSDWILKVLNHCEELQETENNKMDFRDGGFIKIMGNDYSLSIIYSLKNRIELKDKAIIIYSQNSNDISLVENQWMKWFDSYIKEILNQVVAAMYPRFLMYQINMPIVKIRAMKTRWGSCSVFSNCITLNKYLIHAPIECIEYVAVHELAHFLQPNHSRKFYDIVYRIMPDYKQRIQLLKKQVTL